MLSRIAFAVVSAVALAMAVTCQADETTRKAEEYPARTNLGNLTLAAENLGPAVPTPSGGLFMSDYIAIDVAVFARGAGTRALIRRADFALRINGAKVPIHPDAAGAVAASVKYPDWEQRTQLEGRAGLGDSDVVIGRPRSVERFPGDNRPTRQQGSGPMPRIENPVARKRDETPVEELVERAQLPEGDVSLPVSGCLYFYYKGKLKSIKKLELVYEGPLGEGLVRIP
jgi:hypothetical protein